MKRTATLFTAPICCPDAVVQGSCYRFTVLTSSLLRLEYNEQGKFEDRATQVVVDRNFPVPPYSVHRDNGILTLETDALLLTYNEAPFSPEGLQIRVKAMPDAVWQYGQVPNDLRGTYRTLDDANGPVELGPGVVSREGFALLDDSSSMALTEDGWITPRSAAADLYFFGHGHRYTDALRDFYHLTGHTPLLPRYTMGNWWSRYYKYSEESYNALMDRFEAEGLPFTVAVIDMDWHRVDDVPMKYVGTKKNYPGWTGYTWNRSLFPDPERFLAGLHARGMKTTLNVHPADGVRAFEDIYPRMAEAMGIDPATEQAVEFDVADPKFMEVYFDLLHHELEQQGVDFWWLDWQQGTRSKQEGLDPLWMLNHFHYLDSSWKGTRPLTFSRYAGPGSHRYPIGFSGDTYITWESLDFQPYFTSTASNIGYGWWSHDIGGHMFGKRDDELMARWIQLGVFSPIQRLHSTSSEFNGKEPWCYDAATRQVMNDFLRLRHSLIPYLYTMNRRAAREDLPLVQPMYYLEPEQDEAYQVPNEFRFGTELLVSPITQPANSVSRTGVARTWLPEGLWADWFTGQVYRGGRMMDLHRDIHTMPVLLKDGAIVPLRDTALTDNRIDNPEAMEVRIFPTAANVFTLWEDPGDTPEDLDENWAATRLVLDAGGSFTVEPAAGNLSVLPQKRSWKLVFYGVGSAAPTVLVNGIPQEIETAYDAEHQLLTVRIAPTLVTAEIQVRFSEGFPPAEDIPIDRCYPILLRAQMSFDAKNKTWKLLNSQGRTADLSGVEGLDPDVLACLQEALTA